MTRLTEKDIATVTEQLEALDATFDKMCGAGLREIAARASGVSPDLPALRTAVVPVTAGLGKIHGFSSAVCAILRYIGADAFVTTHTDVAGIYEAYEKGAACLFCADDARYMAVHRKTGKYSDNGDATGRGFAAALELAAGSLFQEEVLVAGAGPVGRAAAAYLSGCGARVTLLDHNPAQLQDLPWAVRTDLSNAQYRYILEATPSRQVICAEHVTPDGIVTAPGILLGIEAGLAQRLMQQERLIHNPLELGTAVMYADMFAPCTA